MTNTKVVIIGAGVAGLVAARHLEEAGLSPLIIEASDRVGGRIKTDETEGFQLDHGFQVLLTQYREAQRYLDYPALQLANFRPGATVYRNGIASQIVDPLREPSQLFTAAFSPVGSIKDKFLVFKLQRELRHAKEEELFSDKVQITSRQFLEDYGFTQKFIDAFFVPFFGGIFLENKLDTPAPMLRFVFKMFGEGYATLPAQGMEAIPQQLQNGLTKTKFLFHSQAAAIKDEKIVTTTGQEIPYDALIIATAPEQLLPQLAGAPTSFNATSTYYYASTGYQLPSRLIGLVADKSMLINNFCQVNQVAEHYAPATEQLLSVTLKDIPTERNAEEKIAQEVRQICQQPNWKLRPLACYDIPRALPKLNHLSYDYQPTAARLTERIFLAGDQMLFGSLDAAMRSGRRAAEGVLGGGKI
jgi:phytoene dehydrogenase-like protein